MPQGGLLHPHIFQNLAPNSLLFILFEEKIIRSGKGKQAWRGRHMSAHEPYFACSASEVLSCGDPTLTTWSLNRWGPEGVSGVTRER